MPTDISVKHNLKNLLMVTVEKISVIACPYCGYKKEEEMPLESLENLESLESVSEELKWD